MMQISSCLIIFVCHLAIGFSLKSVADGEKGGILSWLPLIALPVCVFMFNAGVGNMPFVMLSEVFAAEVDFSYIFAIIFFFEARIIFSIIFYVHISGARYCEYHNYDIYMAHIFCTHSIFPIVCQPDRSS